MKKSIWTILINFPILLAITVCINANEALSDVNLPCKDGKASKFCNIILYNQGQESIIGLRRFFEEAKKRGVYGNMRVSIILNGAEPEIQKNERSYFRSLYDDGHEIGIEKIEARPAICQWLNIPADKITFVGAQFQPCSDVIPEQQVENINQKYRSSANVCVEGCSLKEFWDCPHNWEGAPMFPYWIQWDSQKPLTTNCTNRELSKKNAILELHWATRTLWHNYDRYPIPQCWHFGEPLKKNFLPVGQLVGAGQGGGWWRAELEQYEENLRAGRTPFLYLNTASEANIFVPGGPWAQTTLDPNEALVCAVDLIELLLEHHWQLLTVSQFTEWYSNQWPCPSTPSMVYLMKDTLDGRKDKEGNIIKGHGKLLHAETKYFQICDHENKMTPEIVIAYALETPNLLRGGYTFANPKRWNSEESKAGHIASTTGNALFMGASEPLKSIKGEYYFIPYKPQDCQNRTFTFYLGDDWKPYQFTQGVFSNVTRDGQKISWTKEMKSAVPGTDIRVRYKHILDGDEHRINIEVFGKDAEKLPARFRVCPYFHQGWDYYSSTPLNDPNVPDPCSAGQERNVFARIGQNEFAFSEVNKETIVREFDGPVVNGNLQLMMYNRNPGVGKTCDDNPDFNRGFTLSVNNVQAEAKVKFIDLPGANRYVTAVVELGKHHSGKTYEFVFRYWKGSPKE